MSLTRTASLLAAPLAACGAVQATPATPSTAPASPRAPVPAAGETVAIDARPAARQAASLVKVSC